VSETIRLVILDPLPEARQLVATMLGFDADIQIVGQAATVAEALPLLESQHPDLVLISDTVGFEDVPRIVWQLTSRSRTTGMIVISAQTGPEKLRRAMLAGARGFVERPVDARKLRVTVHEVFARVSEERRDREQRLVPPTAPLVIRRTGTLGHVVAVFGAKGGVGKTTVSVNLAVTLRQMTGRSVALIDADLTLGDAALYFDLAPVHTILDVIDFFNSQAPAETDPELIKSFMARYEPLGLRVLFGPARPEHAELVTAAHLKRLFAALPRLFDYIVVDCPLAYDERVLTMLDYADQILFLVTPEVGPLKNARHFLDLCETLGYPRERVQVVLNRADSQVSINANDVHRWLAYPVSFGIQSGGARVAEAANRGVPLVIQDPRNPTSQDVATIASAVVRAADSTRQRKDTDKLRRPEG
jgi:pilus assembly protein CpaE